MNSIENLDELTRKAQEAYRRVTDFSSVKQRKPFNKVYQDFLVYQEELKRINLNHEETRALGTATEKINGLMQKVIDKSREGVKTAT